MSIENIYFPSDDSFFIVSFIEKNVKYSYFSVDVGTGSGIIAFTLARISEKVLATDIKYASCYYAWSKSKEIGIDYKIDVICCEDLSALREDKVFDIVVSNPPYLPCEEIYSAECGGKNGIEIAARIVLESIKRILKGGKIYIVLSSLSNISKFKNFLLRKELKYSIAHRGRIGLFEELYIFEITGLTDI